MFSLDPAKLDQVPAAPLLLSHVTVLNALVCDFLPGLQSWAGLLRVPTNPLQRRTFHSIGSTHGEPATRWSVRVRHVECGGTVGQLGGFAGETAHAQWLTGRLPGGVCATVNRIFVPLMPSLSSTFCPHFLVVPDISVSAWGDRAVGVFGTTGDAGHLPRAHFSPWETSWAIMVSWHRAVPAEGRGDSGEGKRFLLCSLICPLSSCLSRCCGEEGGRTLLLCAGDGVTLLTAPPFSVTGEDGPMGFII